MPDAATLRAQVDAAKGAEPANYRDTIVETGSYTGRTIHYQIGKDYRETDDEGPVHTEEGTFQGESWHLSANGLVVVEQPDPVNETVASGGDRAVATVTRVTTPVDGYLIAELNRSGHGTRTYVDPVSHQPLREEIISARGTRTYVYSGYRTFGTYTVPTQWTYENTATGTKVAFTRELAIGAATPADIAEPDTSRSIVAFPAGVRRVDLPVRFENDRMYVRVMIGGRGYDFVLDTGSGSITLNADVAKQLGLTMTNEITAIQAGKVREANTIVPLMTVGPLTMHDVAVVVVPVEEQTDDTKIVGLLGFDFLATLGVHIDYVHKTVWVEPGQTFTAPAGPGAYRLDVRLGTQQPVTTVVLDGVVAPRFALDTGADGTMMIFDGFASRHPDAFRVGVSSQSFIGVGGTFTSHGYNFGSVRLGSIAFTNFIGYRISTPDIYDDEWDGLLGTQLLHFFNLDLDFLHGQIFLTVNANGKQRS